MRHRRQRPFRPPQAAAALLDRLPEHSTGLAALAAQTVDDYRHLAAVDPDTHTPTLAGRLNNLSNRLADLGRREDALTAIDEATTPPTGRWPPPTPTPTPPTWPRR